MPLERWQAETTVQQPWHGIEKVEWPKSPRRAIINTVKNSEKVCGSAEGAKGLSDMES